jgi:hypothetical protein
MNNIKQSFTGTVSTSPEQSTPRTSEVPTNPAGFAGSAGTPAGTPGASPSMASSVTRHALISPAEEFQYLICGMDSLDLGLYVHWDENWP